VLCNEPPKSAEMHQRELQCILMNANMSSAPPTALTASAAAADSVKEANAATLTWAPRPPDCLS
jgi:hypothetical protein